MSDENPLGTRVQLLVHKMKDAVHPRRRLPGTLMNINFFLFSLVLIALVGLISKKTNLYVQQTFLLQREAPPPPKKKKKKFWATQIFWAARENLGKVSF